MATHENQIGFDDLDPDAFADAPATLTVGGYRGPVVCQIVGISYRQLDYWARTHLVEPSVRSAAGSGSQRLYSFPDIVLLRIVKRLLDTGISLQNIRIALDQLRDRPVRELTATTLMCDGTTVYECTDDAEVIDLLRGGQGVFAVAIGASVTELSASVSEIAAEPATPDDSEPGIDVTDELAQRRKRKSA